MFFALVILSILAFGLPLLGEEKPPAIYDYRMPIEETAVLVGAEFLYWTVEESSLNYAVDGTGGKGITKHGDFDWNPGVRAHLGYRFRRDFWEVVGQYTYFHTNGSDSTGAPLTTAFPSLNIGTVSRATSGLSFDYQGVDLYLARRFLVSKALILKLMMGATGAFFDQDWTVKYFGTEVTKIRNDWRYSAGGIRFGLDSDWYLGRGFSFVGLGSLAGLVGNYKNDTFIGKPSMVFQNTRLSDTRGVFHVQMRLGPSYGKRFERCAFQIFATYELNVWANLQEMLQATGTTSTFRIIQQQSNVGLHGLTAGIHFSF